MNDFNKYTTAVNAFRLEFNAISGDMDNATEYWGERSANDATDGTNDGNGDGIVSGNSAILTAGEDREDLLSWQHLSLAGIVPGAFSGTPATGTGYTWNRNPGSNVPEGPDGSYFVLLREQIYQQLTATSTNPSGADTTTAVYTPKEARAIDTKIDDGNPWLGKMIGRNSPGCSGSDCFTRGANNLSRCVNVDKVVWDATDAEKQEAEYILSETSKTCYMMYYAFQ